MTLLEILLAPFVIVGTVVWTAIYFMVVLLFTVLAFLYATAIVWVPLAVIVLLLRLVF